MNRRHVLIIGQENETIASELSTFTALSYDVSRAPGLHEGLARLSRGTPDCVLLDESLGAPSEVSSILSRMRSMFPRIPVVLLTNGRACRYRFDRDAESEQVYVSIDKQSANAVELHGAINTALARLGSQREPIRRSEPVTHVLIIDHNADDREACIRALARLPEAHYRFVEAADGETGLSAISSQMPDVVLLDDSLSTANGLDVLARIHESYPDLPVIILTEQENETVAVPGLKLGATDYLSKSSLSGEILQWSIVAAMKQHRYARTIDHQNSTIFRQREFMEASNHFLHGLVDHIPDPVFVVDRARHWLLVNLAFRELIDCGPTAAGCSDIRIMPEEAMESFWQQNELALDAGSVAVTEQRILNRNGEWRLFSVNRGHFTDRKDNTILMGVMRDVTEQRQAEDDFKRQTARLMRQSEELAAFGGIFEESLNEVFIVDAATLELLQVNKGARLNLGYSQQELEGMNLLDIRTQLSTQSLRDLLKPLESGQEIKIVYHSVHKRKDGTLYDAEVHAQMTMFQGKRVFVQIVLDETERKRIERMKSEFISTVSHELRTPLTSIRGALGLITAGAVGPMPEKAAGLIAIAHSNAERLVRLVNDILDLEKTASGNMPLDLREIPVAEFLKQAVQGNAGYGIKNNVQFVTDCPRGDFCVLADHGRLMQVMANLISNAVKFSPPGGVVRVGAMAMHGKIRFEVEDHGCGISEEFRPRVFGRFAQADATIKRQYQGTGLGLCITKELVEAMHGHIGFASSKDSGTTFFFELPQALTGQLAGASMEDRVLICEDDADAAFLMKTSMEQAGFKADVASTIAESRSKLAMGHYAALTLDLKMPDANGLDFLRELRSEIATCCLPVIVVSGSAEQEKFRFGSRAGVSDWIPKPLDHVGLVRAIQKAIRGAQTLPRVLYVGNDAGAALSLADSLADRAKLFAAKTLAESWNEEPAKGFDILIVDAGITEDLDGDMAARLGEIPHVLIRSGNGWVSESRKGEMVAGTRIAEVSLPYRISKLLKSSSQTPVVDMH